MAGTYNKVILIGRLGRDPELRYTQTGMPVANFPLATDESFVDRDGNRQERTEWHRIVVWDKQAETVANYLSKGRLVLVEGSIYTRKWQDSQGQDRYTTEIRAQRVIFLDSQKVVDLSEEETAKSETEEDIFSSESDSEKDRGPIFPSETSDIDDVPF